MADRYYTDPEYRKVVDEDFLEYIDNKPGIIIYKFLGDSNGRFN